MSLTRFDSRIQKIGGSYYMRIPPKLADHLKLRNKKQVQIQAEEGQHGPYLSAWNPDQQKELNTEFTKASQLNKED